ncbi:MAG TPA: sugar phosphate isomerase/epimerase family protein, partial [Tepidisphaeraceae bacterium]|nr:sugar phosphate isomerase/epimerase family protein [Tepidisphaeraceae bacterium]
NSVSTGGATLDERLSAYSKTGFKLVEFQLGQVKKFLAEGKTVADARKLLDGNGLKCIGGFETSFEVFSTAESREKNHATVLANAKLIADLGGTNFVVGTDGPPAPMDCEKLYDTFASAFATLADQIKPLGVNVLIEFNWSPIIKSFRTAAEIARRTSRSNVGVLFDPAHYHCTPTKFDQLTPENIKTIKHVHVNNMRNKPAELSHCNADRVLPGHEDGCLDLKMLFGQLEKHGYRGLFSIEMFSDELWQMPALEASKKMYESLLTLCED